MKKLILIIVFILLPSLCFSQNYYVKNGGNDSLAGTSDATAWETIDKVNNTSMVTGDDVFFKCGDEWSLTANINRIYMDWEGTAVNRVIIGAYYMDGDTEVIGVSGNKPIFNANKVYPLGDWDESRNGDAFRCWYMSYITIQDLRIINSKGRGINVAWGTSMEALRVETDSTTASGIQFYDIEDGLIEDCDVREHGQIFNEYPGHNWPAGIAVVQNGHNVTVRHCKIHEGYGEGIGNYFYSDNTIIEDNILYDNRCHQIYISAAQYATIRRNVIYHTTNQTYWRDHTDGVRSPSYGIAVGDEPYYAPYISYVDIYDNFISGERIGISLFTDSNDHPNDLLKDVNVYNNSIIDCKWGFYIPIGPFQNCNIKNNIIWSITSTSDWPAGSYYGLASTPGITWSNNNWTTTAAYPYSGTGDVIGTANLLKTSGWRSIVNWDDLDYDDFSVTATSPGIETGVNLGSAWKDLLEAENINWSNDYFPTKDQNNYGTGWEMGADIYDTGGSPSTETEKVYKGIFF